MPQNDLSPQQQSLLKQLQKLEASTSSIHTNPIRSHSQIKSSEIIKQNHNIHSHKRSIIKNQNPLMNLPIQYDQQHQKLKKQLFVLKQQSQKVYKLGQYLKNDQQRFKQLLFKKDNLVSVINQLQGQTAEYVQKQRKMIDLSVAIKQILQHYQYISKFQFNWTCQISQREMFEDNLVTVLSELTQGVQFFQNKKTFHSSSKYLQLYQDAKIKVSGFIKSFLIKLLNRENQFIAKNLSKNKIQSFLSYNLYPKSKLDLANQFLISFPQTKLPIKDILLGCKQIGNQNQINNLSNIQDQIQCFYLLQCNISLIKYLQTNIRDLYDQVILKSLAYYRSQFHENLIKNHKSQENKETFDEYFKRSLIFSTYILSVQYCYLVLIARPDNQALCYINSLMKNLGQSYMRMLLKNIKDSKKNQHPFQICQILEEHKKELKSFLEKSAAQQYRGFLFGQMFFTSFQILNQAGLNPKQFAEYLHTLLNKIASKIQSQLQIISQHSLPTFKISNSQKEVAESVSKLLKVIPLLHYCPNTAQKYLISSLDAIIKSIKQCNNKMQSRFYCYMWNLKIFAAINKALDGIKFQIVSSEYKVDIADTATIINKIKEINRQEGILKYAQDIFATIKTGMPTINQLTLDFTKYIRQHYAQLQNRFIKDITFIYGKNLIQILQRIAQLKKIQDQSQSQAQIKQICKQGTIKVLYSGFLLSIQNFIRKSKEVLASTPTYDPKQKIFHLVIGQVYQNLMDLLSEFYIQLSNYVSYVQEFQDIQVLKKKHKAIWKQKDSEDKQKQSQSQEQKSPTKVSPLK